MKRILVVVDYQRDFVDGALGFAGAEALEAPILEKIAAYQKDGEVVYTLDTHGEDYLQTREGLDLPVPHCLKGTPGHELYGRVKEALQDARGFEKGTFGSGNLYEYLKKGAYAVIELCGLVSNICVLSNAVLAKAACPEARILVDPACTASADPQLHEAAMEILKGIFVETTGE